jgi:hypothetical protein
MVFAMLVGAIAAPISVLWFLYIRWRRSANIGSNMRRLLAEGSNRSILGFCDMELVGNRLNVKRPLIDASYDLRAIEKIVGNDEYTFVYYSSITAFVIPMRLYPEEEYAEFVAALKDAWENRDVPVPASVLDERIAARPLR